ncbi:Hypothetical protein, putative [Bodo saltans]|uniref:Uncharacterized protein n=1 Tax=Bodo saltans TaxID=75058 RepID=A0A0S4IQ92_BODSA|nr:Hypothetical protein, putative [Bodo saltans]|eukprot:CUF94100.1 Hypothetical protein, putative [Bodo saltans]
MVVNHSEVPSETNVAKDGADQDEPFPPGVPTCRNKSTTKPKLSSPRLRNSLRPLASGFTTIAAVEAQTIPRDDSMESQFALPGTPQKQASSLSTPRSRFCVIEVPLSDSSRVSRSDQILPMSPTRQQRRTLLLSGDDTVDFSIEASSAVTWLV